MPEKNSGLFSHSASVKLLLFPFHSVEPPSTTSKILNPLNILLLQTRPNCLGRSWNPSTKRPERQLHVCYTACLATQSAWNHLSPLFSLRGLSLPTFQLNDARMRVSVEENGSKNTYKAMILPHSCSCTRSKQTTTVTCITWKFSLSPQFLKTADIFISSPFMEKLSGSDYLLPKSHWKKYYTPGI